MATYRAASFNNLPKTTSEEPLLPEQELIEAAVAEAYRGNIIGDVYSDVTEEDFRTGLEIGNFTD